MGSCFSLLFNPHCKCDYDDCCDENCFPTYQNANYAALKVPAYDEAPYEEALTFRQKYNLPKPSAPPLDE